VRQGRPPHRTQLGPAQSACLSGRDDLDKQVSSVSGRGIIVAEEPCSVAKLRLLKCIGSSASARGSHLSFRNARGRRRPFKRRPERGRR